MIDLCFLYSWCDYDFIFRKKIEENRLMDFFQRKSFDLKKNITHLFKQYLLQQLF